METRVARVVEEVEELPICEETVVTNERGEVVAKAYRLC